MWPCPSQGDLRKTVCRERVLPTCEEPSASRDMKAVRKSDTSAAGRGGESNGDGCQQGTGSKCRFVANTGQTAAPKTRAHTNQQCLCIRMALDIVASSHHATRHRRHSPPPRTLQRVALWLRRLQALRHPRLSAPYLHVLPVYGLGRAHPGWGVREGLSREGWAGEGGPTPAYRSTHGHARPGPTRRYHTGT